MINVVAGSREQDLYAVLGDSSGPEDLTGKTVVARFRKAGRTTTLFEASCTVENALTGSVSMPWPADWEDHLDNSDGTAIRSAVNCEVQWIVTTTATSKENSTVNVTKVKVHPKFAAVT
jgi:hypothetical protein